MAKDDEKAATTNSVAATMQEASINPHVRAIYSGKSKIIHEHGVLLPNHGLVELARDNYKKLKRLFPNDFKTEAEVSQDYSQTGANQTGVK
jgi:hypothetical protein